MKPPPVRAVRLPHAALLLAAALWSAVAAAAAQPRFEMPPEWAPHDAVWMGWSDEPPHHPVQVQMIRALLPHVTVRLQVMDAAAEQDARAKLAAAGIDPARVWYHRQPVGNAWIRDAGPLFLSDGTRLKVPDFAWNWYGYPPETTRGWTSRDPIDREMAARLGLEVVRSEFVAEGGAFDFSDDAILTYRDTALQRHPGRTLAEIEAEYLRVFGKDRIVWLSRSPPSDLVGRGPKAANYVGWGANGHVDEYARFVDDRTIVVARIDPEDRDNPLSRADGEVLDEHLAELRAATDAQGRPFRVIELSSPALRHHVRTRAVTAEDRKGPWARTQLKDFAVGDEIHVVPALSYLNFFVTNGVVLLARYWREGLPERERAKDEAARALFATLFPDREIVQIDPLAINFDGGGMHCQTQQQPRVPPRPIDPHACSSCRARD
jgi:agmatine deiminase